MLQLKQPGKVMFTNSKFPQCPAHNESHGTYLIWTDKLNSALIIRDCVTSVQEIVHVLPCYAIYKATKCLIKRLMNTLLNSTVICHMDLLKPDCFATSLEKYLCIPEYLFGLCVTLSVLTVFFKGILVS